MNNNIDLKELWHKQQPEIPGTKELFEKANAFKKKNLRKLIIANIVLLLTSAFIVFIWYYYEPKMITTKIGIILSILGMFLYLFVYNQIIPLLMDVGYEKNSSQYLQQLLKLKEKQLFLDNIIGNIYFILLTIGLCLYMFEYISCMTLFWAAFIYGITLLWMAFVRFYFTPKAIKKQRARINELISRFEMVSRQLTTNE
ncbi:MAG: hypothetical protein WKG06_04920 [Segetibacter sp.]